MPNLASVGRCIARRCHYLHGETFRFILFVLLQIEEAELPKLPMVLKRSGLIHQTLSPKSQTFLLDFSSCLSDEVATLLLYVKTLGYQDKPDYQHLRAVLASAVTGSLDFSTPGGAAVESPAEVRDTSSRDKVRT